MGTSFSAKKRIDILEEMSRKQLDVLVIGGGITGAGIALDAASRGMEIGLVEMQDFAAGTSSRSTKLVHGGLRYLKQFEVKMVADVGKEREIVYENGPHVTTPEWMLLPFYKEGTFGPLMTSVGLRVYDYLAGVKKTERREMLSPKEVLEKEPMLKKNGLLGGGYYVEYRTDDARLTIEVLKAAITYGAKAANYAKVDRFIYENGKAVGAKITDQLTGVGYDIYAKKIINATGPWVDFLREIDGSKQGKSLFHTKGIHLVFDQSVFPLTNAIYYDTSDERMVFAIPRDGKTYVGTTDTAYNDDLKHPKMTQADQDYMIRSINFMFPELAIEAKHVESSWAGIRPLIHEDGKAPSEISRKDEIWESDSGLITIAGGKLTGYRKMAEMIVDLLAKKFKQEGYKLYSKSKTKSIPLSGGDVGGSKKFPSFLKSKVAEGMNLGLSEEEASILANRYGSNVDILFKNIKEYPDNECPKFLYAELKYGLDNEMVIKPTDFFIRRTGLLFFDIDYVNKWKKTVIEYMASYFKWDTDQKSQYTYELETELQDAVNPIEK